MTMLMGKSCWTLVVQVLFVKLLCTEMHEYCGCCGKFMLPNGNPLEG
jgi:hypothetical protein